MVSREGHSAGVSTLIASEGALATRVMSFDIPKTPLELVPSSLSGITTTSPQVDCIRGFPFHPLGEFQVNDLRGCCSGSVLVYGPSSRHRTLHSRLGALPIPSRRHCTSMRGPLR